MSIMQTNGQGPLYPVVSKMSDDDFNDVSSAGRFLPRLQLYTASSTPVKKNEIQQGRYGIVDNKKIKDLGTQFDCIPFEVRAKAMDLRGTGGKKVISVFDKRSPAFAEIRGASAVSDSKCMYGSEFLLWLPSEEKWATFFFGNPTLRRVAPEIKELLGWPVTCGVRFIDSDQYGGWHAPTIVKCTTPLSALPNKEEAEEQINLFNAVQPSVEGEPEEEVEETEPARAR